MKKRKWLIVLIAVLVPILLGVGFVIWQYNQACHECIVEAGVTVTPSDFLYVPDDSAVYTDKSDTVDTRIPGDYTVYVKTKLFIHKCILHVYDTIAPSVEPVQTFIEYGATASPEDFVNNISDATKVTLEFVETPDFSKEGVQEVKVMLTDLGGNQVMVVSKLTISFVKSKVVIEAGSEPAAKISDFLLKDCEATLKTDISGIDYNHVGYYPVVVEVNGKDCESILEVADTVAPSLEVSDASGFTGVGLPATRLVVFADDVTDVHIEYAEEPDFSKEGTQTVYVKAVDEGGNETVCEAQLTLGIDAEPPVISGVADFVSYTGHAISFKNGLVVTDNNPDGLVLDIDDGGLNINIPGEYTITYTATDASGNSTVKTITIAVKGKEYTDEAVWELCDKVLAKIIKPNMDELKKVEAIWKYVRSNIVFYSGHSTKLFWQQGAIDAFVDGTGDCYMYACMSKALLTRAGIPNIDICRSDEACTLRGSLHFWNLVNVGGGWLHFDALPMKDGTSFFLWSDSQIKEYDLKHPGYHAYDPTLYPEIVQAY